MKRWQKRWYTGELVCFLVLVLLGGCGSDERDAAENKVPQAKAPAGLQIHGSATFAATKPLNVLLITIDTTRADALGVYGQTRPTTPNIDRIARRGVIFRNASSVAPLTLPAHASIMTGTYPFVHGARTNDGYVLSDENVTLAEILKGHGYRTAAEIDAVVLNRRTGMNQGFDSYRDLDSPNIERMEQVFDTGETQKKLLMQERYARDITRSGIAFLKSARTEPFFLWLHYFAPHAPYVPPPKISAQIPDDPYLAEVRLVDREIGVALKAVQDLGLLENTLVVITSDHGESRGEHREPTHSLFVYESTLHVPLIFAGPDRLPKGAEVRTVVRLIDIAPTILDLLGLPPMDDAQGISLVPVFEDPAVGLDLMAYGESAVSNEIFGSSVLRSLRRGEWKYIHKLKPELYHLTEDPSERRDLAKGEPERVSALRSSLKQLISNAPASIRSERVALSPLEKQQLAMLGYVTGGVGVASGVDFADSVPHGPDPTELIDDITLYSTSQDLLSLGNIEGSFEILGDLVARYPGSQRFVEAYLLACFKLKRYEPAMKAAEKILKKKAQQEDFWPDFANWILAVVDSRDVGAIPLLESMQHHETCNREVRLKLAEAYHIQRRYGDERDFLEAGIEDCGPSLGRMNNLANLLATCSVAEVRDGKRALELASRAAEMTKYAEPAVLDTLASAYAEVGDFEKAVATSQKAISLLESRNSPKARRAGFQARLENLLESKPIREK